MDPRRFDNLAVRLAAPLSRRRGIGRLALLGIGSLVALDDVAARKKKKKKKKCKACGACQACTKGKCKPQKDGTACGRGICQRGTCLTDTAPPCVSGQCPLPPGCAAPDVEDCAQAFVDALMLEIEPCRTLCEGGDSPSCRACLEPIVIPHASRAERCVAIGCDFRIAASDAAATLRHAPTPRAMREVQAAASGWWTRTCGKPTCCYNDLEACLEGTRDSAGKCAVPAILPAFVAGPAAVIPGAIICLSNYAYDTAACFVRHGCVSGQCVAGDICTCTAGGSQCGSSCCPVDTTCCGGKTCCGKGSDGGERYCCGDRCCPVGTNCFPGGGDEPSTCCYPGAKPCHGICCSGSDLVLCCQSSNGVVSCAAVGVGCPP